MIRLIVLVGIALAPACGPMPTKPRAMVAVSGKVTDRLGSPIVGASVDYYPATNSLAAYYRAQQSETDSTGSYEVELAAGLYKWVIGLPSNIGANPYYESKVTVSPKNSRFDYVVDGFRVSGRVIAPTGAALTDAQVYAASLSPGTRAASSTQPGVFSLLLPAATYYFGAVPSYWSGFPPSHLDGVPIQADTTFDIPLGGDRISGTVYGPGGAPLENVLVTAIGPIEVVRALTALDGTYAFFAHAGEYRFLCQPVGSNSYILSRISSIRTVTGPATFDFDLSGVECTGTVRSSATLSPIEGVDVSATMFADSYYRSARATTSAVGQFRLVLEPGREYSLRFRSSATAELTYPGFTAVNDTTFDILLDPAPAP